MRLYSYRLFHTRPSLHSHPGTPRPSRTPGLATPTPHSGSRLLTPAPPSRISAPQLPYSAPSPGPGQTRKDEAKASPPGQTVAGAKARTPPTRPRRRRTPHRRSPAPSLPSLGSDLSPSCSAHTGQSIHPPRVVLSTGSGSGLNCGALVPPRGRRGDMAVGWIAGLEPS